ncbi:MAG: hypothetical protein LC118_10460 [Dehalococcoidia bacterium]|nr:hypothetical protein [Dehalococcoidia bacterium]
MTHSRLRPLRGAPGLMAMVGHSWLAPYGGGVPNPDTGDGVVRPASATDGVVATKALRHDGGDDGHRTPNEEEVESGGKQRVDHVSTSVRLVKRD